MLPQITKFTTQNNHASGTQTKLKQLKPRFGRLLRLPAWKQSRHILKEKGN